ncbi:hypothetical protein K438DRAFT_2085770 [Mycena galopus ATCC 62051]|nr:hypothetical protein K438DRAFT_2085770 [Mycena galopus ATCC 62051]
MARRQPFAATAELTRWAGVIYALAFFTFFGFAAEARKNYRITFWAVAKRCNVTPPPDGAPLPRIRLPRTKPKTAPFATGSSSGKSLPISLPLTPVKQRPDSLFTDTVTGSETDAHSQMSMEKACACQYILLSPSSSPAFGPPHPQIRLPWSKSKTAPQATDASGKSLPISLPLTPVKQRPDSLFADTVTGCDTDAHSQMSMETGHACEYIMPSPSSSSAFGPPHYARDIEEGAYAKYPSPASYDGTNSEGQWMPTSVTADVESPSRPRPTTWPSLHSSRPPASAS